MLKELLSVEDHRNRIIEFIESHEISVNCKTKAKGHKGFFVGDRIVISKELGKVSSIGVIAHEFAHYIHYKLEGSVIFYKGGSLSRLFNLISEAEIKVIEEELSEVTRYVESCMEVDTDEYDNGYSNLDKYERMRDRLSNEIKYVRGNISSIIVNFREYREGKELYREISGIRGVNYLLKYDRVKIVSSRVKGGCEIISVDRIDEDFSDLRFELREYIKLRSLKRRRDRIVRRLRKYQQYYNSPAELFARFIQCLFENSDKAISLAPKSYRRFEYLNQTGYYGELKEFMEFSYS